MRDKLLPFFYKNLDVFLAATVGFLIVYIFTRHSGIGISPDSIVYTSVARNLIQGHGFMEFTGKSVVDFPVGYPCFLALAMFLTGKDILTIAPILNGLMFAAVILLSGIAMNRFKYSSRWYKWMMLALITFSPSLNEIYTMLWSETLFVLLSLAFLLLMHNYFTHHSYHTTIMAAVVAAIAFDTRYAGITLIGTGILLIVFDKVLPWNRKTIYSILFALIGISLVTANLIRNALVSGLATGMRQKGITPLGKNISYSGNVLSDWLNVSLSNRLFFELLAIVAMVFFIFYFIRNVRRWSSYYSFENTIVAFFIVYVSFIVISSTISRYETINNRLLSPAFLPLLWGTTCMIPKWGHSWRKREYQWLFFGFFACLGLFMYASYFMTTAANYQDTKDDGIPGYTEDPWTHSQTIHYLCAHKYLLNQDTTVYSNHNQAIYFFTGYPADLVPERVYKKDVADFKSESPIILVWFDLDPNADLLSIMEISRYKHIETIQTLSDGSIFLLTNSAPPEKKHKKKHKHHYRHLSNRLYQKTR